MSTKVRVLVYPVDNAITAASEYNKYCVVFQRVQLQCSVWVMELSTVTVFKLVVTKDVTQLGHSGACSPVARHSVGTPRYLGASQEVVSGDLSQST